MTADDKFGLGAGALALGLAGGLILLAQLLPGNVFQLPPRQPMLAEQIFDGLVCLIGVPVGIYFFYQGARTKSDD
jgi:hypothetical protein